MPSPTTGVRFFAREIVFPLHHGASFESPRAIIARYNACSEQLALTQSEPFDKRDVFGLRPGLVDRCSVF